MEREKKAPVVSSEVKVKQTKTFKDSLIAKDAKEVGISLLYDTILPSIKKILYDIGNRALGLTLFGDGYQPTQATNTTFIRPYGGSTYVNYGSQYRPQQSGTPTQKATSTQAKPGIFDYTNFVFGSRGDAEKVLSSMEDIIDQFDVVAVSDLYELCQKTAPYTAENYGWSTLSTAKTVPCDDGFMIIWPSVKPLK